jgi:hypothetical protein
MGKKTEPPELVLVEEKILTVRGHRVMLDSDLAKLYGVDTRSLVQAVKRNLERFPEDFMFPLNREELQELAGLRSQSVISNKARGGRRFAPYAFTEQGVAMLSSVLNSKRAVQVNIAIMRTFVRLRSLTSVHRELAAKVLEHEGKLIKHDRALQSVFDAIRQLMDVPPPNRKKQRIGF